MKLGKFWIWFLVVALILGLGACSQPSTPSSSTSPSSTPTQTESPKPTSVRLGVFIPGRLGDSPDYDKLADTAQRMSMRDPRLKVEVFEAGFDQSKWEEQLTSFASSGRFDVIYTSNESMGPMAAKVAAKVPDVKFIVDDSWVIGNPRIYCSLMNKYQQSYLYGYMMALVSTSTMPGVNPDKKIGFIYGQHYTTMDDMIIPGIEAGAKAVDPGFELKTVMLGNWYDATKAESLTNSLIDEGVDVMGAVVGSAVPGVISACKNRGIYMIYYDTAGFDKGPGVIVGAVEANVDDMVSNNLERLLNGTIPWGTSEVFSAEKGYISVPLNAPAYVNSVPDSVRQAFLTEYNKVISGEKNLSIPQSVLDKINQAAQGQ
jgi:basic membrane lipoprotein Med (substrate-binding protein (PBP1-ABC) superfamily)